MKWRMLLLKFDLLSKDGFYKLLVYTFEQSRPSWDETKARHASPLRVLNPPRRMTEMQKQQLELLTKTGQFDFLNDNNNGDSTTE